MFDKQVELNNLKEEFANCADFMLAIGDASRQRILMAIMQGDFGGSRVGDIAQIAHLSNPAVSHHLKILKDAGIVRSYSVGTKNYYYIDAGSAAFKRATELITSFEKVAAEFASIQNYGEED